ncbi:MAG: iron-containing alcohol dehydrogenase [Spirochaetes bacterium]|nr:iron-containing alcohol dehydrogenase [Spirochaetota bacterium]MBU0955833.1 iron-containing alcohol dehydrogenase [Spirochaetota bacterium]
MLPYTIFCRLFQGTFKLVSPLLAWREPELLEGPDSIKQLPPLLQREGLCKLLIVSDHSIRSLGLMDGMLAALDTAAIGYCIYDGTVPNPTIQNIEEAARLYRNEGCDGIIAFGGGSPMDCAKGVGARIARPRKPIAKMKGLLRVGRHIPPLVAIPTTAGTGSEATLAAVISNPETHEKYPINDHVLIPHFAVLDPNLTLGLPPHITSTTGMDVLTHAIEAYIGRSNTRETASDALEAARLVFAYLPTAFSNGKNVDARGYMLKAAYLGGKAFTRAYVGYVHAIAHTLGGFYQLPHGLANSIILPHVLDYYGRNAWKRLAQMARYCDLADSNMDDQTAASRLISRIREMNKQMNIPESVDGIKTSDVPLMVRRALAEANPLYPVPRILGTKEMTELYSIVRGGKGLVS